MWCMIIRTLLLYDNFLTQMILSYLKLGIWSLIQKNIKPHFFIGRITENDRKYTLAGNSIFYIGKYVIRQCFCSGCKLLPVGSRQALQDSLQVSTSETHITEKDFSSFCFHLVITLDFSFMICNLSLKHSWLWLHFRLLMLNFTNRRWKANNFGPYTEKSHCGSHHKHGNVLSFRKLTQYQCNVKLEMLPVLLSSLTLLHCIYFTLMCVKYSWKPLLALKEKKSVLLQIDDLSEALSGDQELESKREEFFCFLKAHVCMYQEI